jgi:hypothetical protein
MRFQKQLSLSSLVILTFGVSAGAQEAEARPDFSGVWVMDEIEHRGGSIKIKRDTKSMQGGHMKSYL